MVATASRCPTPDVHPPPLFPPRKAWSLNPLRRNLEAFNSAFSGSVRGRKAAAKKASTVRPLPCSYFSLAPVPSISHSRERPQDATQQPTLPIPSNAHLPAAAAAADAAAAAECNGHAQNKITQSQHPGFVANNIIISSRLTHRIRIRVDPGRLLLGKKAGFRKQNKTKEKKKNKRNEKGRVCLCIPRSCVNKSRGTTTQLIFAGGNT